jgi:hypothetical protein
MTVKQKKIRELLLSADRLLGESLRLHGGKNWKFREAITDSQLLIDDAIAVLEAESSTVKKSKKKFDNGRR